MGVVIRSGSVRVSIVPNRDGARLRHEIRWTDLRGRRRKRKRSNAAEARAEARRIADDLARGGAGGELSWSDVGSFRAGIVNLYGCGRTLEAATAEVAEAHRLAPGVSMGELARFWAAHHGSGAGGAGLSVEEVARRFVASMEGRGVSGRYLEDLRHRLGRFARDVAGPAADVSADLVEQWVCGMGLSARSRNNFLAAVKSLFAHASMAWHPAREGVRLLRPAKLAAIRVAIWSPAEMRRLLWVARERDASLVPVLVLSGFGMLRASEVARLDAADLRLDDGHVVVSEEGKTGGRVVKLPENARAWLREFAPRSGRVWPWSVGAMNARLRRLAGACGWAWRANALRKSAATYGLLLGEGYDSVAARAGNSARMLRRHYVDGRLATMDEARAWFEILPATACGVIVRLRADGGVE
jgi:integrase